MTQDWPCTLSVPFGDMAALAIVVRRRVTGVEAAATQRWDAEVTSAQGEALLRRALAVLGAAGEATANGDNWAVRCTGGRVYRW